MGGGLYLGSLRRVGCNMASTLGGRRRLSVDSNTQLTAKEEDCQEKSLLLDHMLHNAETLAVDERVDVGACIARVGGIHKNGMSNTLKLRVLHAILQSVNKKRGLFYSG